MRRLVLVALVFLACSQQQSGSGLVVTPSPTSSTCRLPVLKAPPPLSFDSSEFGFLSLPGGDFTPVADGGYYDRPLGRWVSGGPPALSADGLRYAHVEGQTTSEVHFVDLRSGTDRLLASGGPWELVGLGKNAVYVMAVEYVDNASLGNRIGKGLWKVPIDSGSPVQLTEDARKWVWVDDRAAYSDGNTLDTSDKPTNIERLDLSTGKITIWFDRHAWSDLVAVDVTGNGFVITVTIDKELWRVTPQGDAHLVWWGPADGDSPGASVAIDGSDVWLSNGDPVPPSVIYHYSPGAGVREFSGLDPDHSFWVAGPCA